MSCPLFLSYLWHWNPYSPEIGFVSMVVFIVIWGIYLHFELLFLCLFHCFCTMVIYFDGVLFSACPGGFAPSEKKEVSIRNSHCVSLQQSHLRRRRRAWLWRGALVHETYRLDANPGSSLPRCTKWPSSSIWSSSCSHLRRNMYVKARNIQPNHLVETKKLEIKKKKKRVVI